MEKESLGTSCLALVILISEFYNLIAILLEEFIGQPCLSSF